ncbi:hypothetical protein J4427_01740 [Candidatus Woesearchaeota archaeon]|nr:hypothetical protein [Candidatus Woesearchaeota archaeon]
MKHSIKRGLSFGLVSGIITTLGLIVGLNSGTHSKLVVLGGILTIAVADAFSDALGMHMSVESENRRNVKEIWESTVSTYVFKLIFALSFAIPVILLPLYTAVIISIIWGLLLIGGFSYYIAKKERIKPIKAIREHLFITILVIVLTYLIGKFISVYFI